MNDYWPCVSVPNDYLRPYYSWNPDIPTLNEFQFPAPAPIYSPAYGNLQYQDPAIPYEFRFPPPPLPQYNPVYNNMASFETSLRYAFGYPPPAPNYYPVATPLYNVQELCTAVPTPPGLGCWQPPPGFNYQCVQLPFPAGGVWYPSLNMPPTENGGMHYTSHVHTIPLPQGAPVSHDRSEASIVDSSTEQPSVVAQQLSLNQRNESHNQEKNKRMSRQPSQLEDQNLDQAVASIFRAPRETVRSRRMPRRPRAPVVRYLNK